MKTQPGGRMNTRRKLLVALGASAFAAPLGSFAQQLQRVPRIGYLSAYSAEFDKPLVTAFLQGLRDLGYVEGKNIVIERRYAAGQLERLPVLAAELAQLKSDVFVVGGGANAARAAMNAESRIPVVMANVSDPVGSGLVASLARPGGNITGLSDFHGASVTKRLELLKEIDPSIARVAVLLNSANASTLPQIKYLQDAASSMRVAILFLEVKSPDDLDRAIATISKERPGALLFLGDPVFTNEQKRLADFALKSRMPAIYTLRTFAEAGGLLSYGTNFAEMWRRAATFVDKILKGTKPGDLPVEQPTKFEMVVNMKTAKTLGIKIPDSILVRADEVIQ